MDMKLPSDINVDNFEKHKQFLEVAKDKDVYVKIVVSNESSLEDFNTALSIIQNIDKIFYLFCNQSPQ